MHVYNLRETLCGYVYLVRIVLYHMEQVLFSTTTACNLTSLYSNFQHMGIHFVVVSCMYTSATVYIHVGTYVVTKETTKLTQI